LRESLVERNQLRIRRLLEFQAVSEKNGEVALSYWNSVEDIKAWREQRLHRFAQSLGRTKWYTGVRVEIAALVRSYSR
jgi:heme-degrading monooxygenase HmoA